MSGNVVSGPVSVENGASRQHVTPGIYFGRAWVWASQCFLADQQKIALLKIALLKRELVTLSTLVWYQNKYTDCGQFKFISDFRVLPRDLKNFVLFNQGDCRSFA